MYAGQAVHGASYPAAVGQATWSASLGHKIQSRHNINVSHSYASRKRPDSRADGIIRSGEVHDRSLHWRKNLIIYLRGSYHKEAG